MPDGTAGDFCFPAQVEVAQQHRHAAPRRERRERPRDHRRPQESDDRGRDQCQRGRRQQAGLGRAEHAAIAERGADGVDEAQRARGGAARTARTTALARQFRPRARHALALENDFSRVAQVDLVLRGHALRERGVLDGDVDFAIAQPARDVEIARADARPVRIGDRGLRVQHRAVPFEYLHAGFEQWTIAGARHLRDESQIARSRHEQPHVDAVARCRAQRLHVGRNADEVGIGEPQGFARHRSDEEIRAVYAGSLRRRRDHAQARRTDRRRHRDVDVERCAELRPAVRERAGDVGAGRSADRDARVAPGREAALCIAEPFLRKADAGDEADVAVDDEQFAMVAADPAERAVESRRIEDAHFSAGVVQRFPEFRAGIAEAAEPVVDDGDAHARRRAFAQRVAELTADVVILDDVVLEKDAVAARADRGEPCVEVGARIDQQLDRVAGAQDGIGRAIERVAGQAPHRARRQLRRRDRGKCGGLRHRHGLGTRFRRTTAGVDTTQYEARRAGRHRGLHVALATSARHRTSSQRGAG